MVPSFCSHDWHPPAAPPAYRAVSTAPRLLHISAEGVWVRTLRGGNWLFSGAWRTAQRSSSLPSWSTLPDNVLHSFHSHICRLAPLQPYRVHPVCLLSFANGNTSGTRARPSTIATTNVDFRHLARSGSGLAMGATIQMALTSDGPRR